MNNPSQVLDQMIADPSINGQHVDVDKQFGGQCWDLVELFGERCGVPKEPWAITLGPLGGAKEAWTVFDSHMQKYFNKIPAGQQQKGDITVYDGHGPYIHGHIAISLGGSSVFEENADPDGAPAHVYNNRSSTYLLGALRLKGDTMQPLTPAQVDHVLKMGLRREPTAEELNNPAYANSAGLLIDTVWNNGGEENYKNPPTAGVNKQSVVDYINKNLK